MFSLGTDSLFFVAFLLLAVFLLRNKCKYREYIFLIINIVIYVCGCKGAGQMLTAALWICTPYLIVKVLQSPSVKGKGLSLEKIRPTLLFFMVAIYAYLMRYAVFTEVIKLPYSFTFRLLGLSYFLFREIDFIMQYDYLKECEIRVSFVDYLNYILSFYTLLAGPILRYEEFVTDFYDESLVTELDFGQTLKVLNRVVNGYVKVYVISAILGYWAKVWYDGLYNHSSALMAVIAFVIFAYLNGWYIYFNFSGYCDIVIGFAQLSGLKVHENFNQPYLAASVAEFWNRHHITLSEWIRDYIYSPMFKAFISGPFEKNIKMGQYVALFITFTIAGVWHGTDANYLVYGLFQGLGITVATIWKDKRKKLLGKEKNKAYEKSLAVKTVGRIVTWMYICLTFSFVGYDVVGLISNVIR